jgi:phage tail-like protein
MLKLRKAYANQFGSGQTFADTQRHDPYKAFRFLVEISGNMVFAKAGFQKASGLKMSTEAIEYREGGDSLTVSKTPGLTTFEPITLERGMSEDVDMWEWASKIFSMDEYNQSNNFRANVKIKLLDREGNVVKTWEVPNCWVSRYETSDFDAQSNNVMIETLELQHEGFKLV